MNHKYLTFVCAAILSSSVSAQAQQYNAPEPIMNEIEAECDCKILSIEVDDATPVEFSTNLVRIQKL